MSAIIVVYVCECIDNEYGDVVQVGMSLDINVVQKKVDELNKKVKKIKGWHRYSDYRMASYTVNTRDFTCFNE